MFGIESINARTQANSGTGPIRAGFDHRAHPCAGESHPVGVPAVFAACDPGLRCAAPWAMELGPFGAGGLRPPRRRRGLDANRGHRDDATPHFSTEGAAFHSPGCTPGYPSDHAVVALKGRHSPGVPFDDHRRARTGFMMVAPVRATFRPARTISPSAPPRAIRRFGGRTAT